MRPLRIQKIIVFVLAAVLAAEGLFFYAQAEGIPFADRRSQIVRVFLSRMGITDRMDITLEGSYQMTTENGTSLHFQSGSELAFLLREDCIYLYYQGMALETGKAVFLERTQEEAGFYRTHFPALYQGDLSLEITQDSLRPVLSIHVEDYLLGVVPYEMGDSFPLEALKAQAVAARTYALRKQNLNQPYDVVDTTNDQVFKGYISGNPLSEQAVRETRGICGFYKGDLAQCFYSASNGGQMELVETVWDYNADYGYYEFGSDPYDVENPQSVVRKLEIRKDDDVSIPDSLRELIAEAIGDKLADDGYDASPESIRVDKVLSVLADTPVAEGNKRMTRLRMALKLSARTRREAVSIRLVDSDTEEVSLFESITPPAATTVPAEQSIESSVPEIVYGDFEPLEQETVLDIPIFPVAEEKFGMDISSNYENEIWSVAETKDSFVIEARRYGHGVGMSQRGAQWMAETYGKNYRDILKFYYPGMKLMQYPEEPVKIVLPQEAFASTAGPAPSPTPRPTLMPVTIEALEGQYYAEVTGISADSSLNLRSEPNLNGTILMRLYKGQKLLVMEECIEEGWVKVKTDAAEGYVVKSYLTTVE